MRLVELIDLAAGRCLYISRPRELPVRSMSVIRMLRQRCSKYDVTMLFWCVTIARYLLAAFVAIFVALVLSFVLLRVVVAAKDDSPAVGLVWFMLAVPLAGLLVPLTLGVTAEMIERKAWRRSFRWSRALFRCGLALPIVFGPIYTWLWVTPYLNSGRKPLWLLVSVALYSVSAGFAYFALRINRDVPQ